MFTRLLAVLACSATVATAQQLTTTFANNNGGAVGGAVYFDLDAVGQIVILELDLNLSSVVGTVGSIDVYVIPGGTYVGNQANPAAWQLIASAPCTAAGAGQPSLVPGLFIPIVGPGACALVANGLAHAYTNGAAPQTTFSGVNLTLTAGSASNAPFTTPTFNPRIVNCNIRYTTGAGTPAANTTVGEGCYERYASFYEDFATAAANDLSGTAITLTDIGSGFAVTPSGVLNAVGSLGAPTPLALSDDSSVLAGTLGLTVHSNGFISFGAGNGNGFTPNVLTFLNEPDSAIRCWHDFNPATVGSGLVQYEEAGTQAQITWDGVFDFGGTLPNTIQFQIDTATGNIVLAFGVLSGAGNGYLVGYSPGGASLDPGSIDLTTSLPLVTDGADVSPLILTASTRPVTGTNWDQQISNIGGGIPVHILGCTDPNIPDLAAIGAPGCGLRASLDLLNIVPTGAFSFPIPINANLVGRQYYACAASLIPFVNAYGAITSNGITGTIGDI